MTAEELRTIVFALNMGGSRAVAHHIGVNERHFRRMCGGTTPISFAVQAAIEKLLQEARVQS